MKNLKEKLIKVIDKIDGFFLQFYPELTKHMNKKDDNKNLLYCYYLFLI